MGLVGQGDTHLSGPKLRLLAVDLEKAASLEDQEDLVTQVVAVELLVAESRFQAQQAGADLGGDQDVALVLFPAKIIDVEGHGSSPFKPVAL